MKSDNQGPAHSINKPNDNYQKEKIHKKIKLNKHRRPENVYDFLMRTNKINGNAIFFNKNIVKLRGWLIVVGI